jgi:hypothetical protein
MLITSERHLQLILSEYADHYNIHRPHRALQQNPPAGHAHPPGDTTKMRVLRRDRLGSLIHEYALVARGDTIFGTHTLPRASWHLQDAEHSDAPASLRPGGRAAGQGPMVIVPGSVVWVLALSVTATVKVNVPAVVGVPEIPAGGRGSSTRPGGSWPERIDHR